MIFDNMMAYRAYDQVINLELCHAFSKLIEKSSAVEDAATQHKNLRERQIWQMQKQPQMSLSDQYGLHYPGEVLERYEAKLGSDIRNLRALALALGYTRAFQSGSQFVGSQREIFIRNVRRAADGDVYLQGALYLLETDPSQQHVKLHKLAGTEYTKTEEALFVLSLFDDLEEGYRLMRPQLIRLLTSERSLSIEDNFGIFEWFILQFSQYAKKYRGKSDMALRALMKLPYMQFKQDSREFETLTAARYSKEEIQLANSLAVWADRIHDRLAAKSVVSEKIAAECCTMLLNQDRELSSTLYDYALYLLRTYQKFHIRYEGYAGLWEAIRDHLDPTAPETICWMCENIKKTISYRFDVFDPRYDLLAKKLNHKKYLELFSEQLLRSYWKHPLKQWIRRYQKLTDADFYEIFLEWYPHQSRIFALFVEKREINLWQFFQKHKDQGRDSNPLDLVRKYAVSIRSWRGYCFVRKLLSEYSFQQIAEISGERDRFHDYFVTAQAYSDTDMRVSYNKPFLNATEKRNLIDWVDTSVFLTAPERYESFVWATLKAPEVQHLYEKKQLAEVLRQMLVYGTKKYPRQDIEYLKRAFFTKEELEADRRAAAERAELAKLAKEQQLAWEMKSSLNRTYDGTLTSLARFLNSYYYATESQAAMDLVYEKLLERQLYKEGELEKEELEAFFKLCGAMVRHSTKSNEEIINMVNNNLQGGAA